MPVFPGGNVSIGGDGGGAGTLGPADNIFGDISGDLSVVPLLVNPAANRAAAETVRDNYFIANPANLAVFDANSNLGIYIYFIDSGNAVTVFQKRIGGNWVDTTVSIGIPGVPGTDGDALFFESIASRDTFFSDPGNLDLLITDLPIAVNTGNETFASFIWTGATNPVSYDATLWRLASTGSAPGTLILGDDGASLSSGNKVINFVDATGTEYIFSGLEVGTGTTPFYWRLGSEGTSNFTNVDTSNLSDPQEVIVTSPAITTSTYFTSLDIKPYETGTLRIEGWAGTVDTDPKILDFEVTIVGGDVGNFTTVTFPNKLLLLSIDSTLFRFSGVGLQGGLQTTGPYTGQTVIDFRGTLRTANAIDIVYQGIDVVTLQEATGFGTSSVDFTDVLDTELLSIGIDGATEDSFITAVNNINASVGATDSFSISSSGANTNPPLQVEAAGANGAELSVFISSVDPEGNITATQGQLCAVVTGVDDTSALWIKETGVGNTGWQNIHSATSGVAGPATSTVDSLPTWNDTTGDSLQDNPFLRYESDGATTSTLILQRAAAGSGEIELRNNADIVIGLIQITGSIFQIDNVGTGDLSLGSGSGDVIVSSNSQQVDIRGGTGVLVENHFLIDGNASDISAILGVPSATNLAEYTIENSSDVQVARLYHDEAALNASGLNLNSNISLLSDSATTLISLISDNSASLSRIRFIDSGSFAQFLIDSDEGLTTNSINSVNYDFDIISGGRITLETFGTEFTRIFSLNGGNTVQTLQLDNGGTNGAQVNIYTSTVDPNGAITANQGDICFVATGVDDTSAVWIKETGAATNTGWINIHSATSGVAGPATSTVNSIPTWVDTLGDEIQDNPFLRYESDGATTSTLILQRAAAGSGEIELRNNADIIVGLMQITGNNFQIDSVNTGDLGLGAAADVFLSALNGAVTITAGGGTLRAQATGIQTAIFEASGSGDVEINANAGSIGLFNNYGEIVMDTLAIAIETATNVNFDVDATASGQINLTAFDPITIHSTDSASTVAIVGNGGDTFPIATYTTNGTGGGTFNLHVGTTTPQGRVSGENTLFFQTGVASSGTARIHYQDTDATATNWNTLTSIPANATQGNGTFMYFPSTDLAQGEPTVRLAYFESGVNTDIEVNSGANGVVALRLKDELVNDRFVITYNDSVPQANITTVASVPLNIFASGNLDMTATGTADLSSAQNLTIETTAANGDINISAFDDCFIFATDELSLTCSGLATLSGGTRTDIITGQTGTNSFMNWSNNTTNIDIFIYNVTPNGAVTGTSGDLLLRNSGVESDSYLNRGAASNNNRWDSLIGNPAMASINRNTAAGGDSKALTATPTNYDGYTTNGPDFGNLTSDQVNDEIAIDYVVDTTNGDFFEVSATISFELTNADSIVFEIYYDNGVSDTATGILARQTSDANTGFFSVTLEGQFRGPTAVTGNGAIKLYWYSPDAGTITFYETRLNAKRLR